jgi:phage terminase small subunit
MGIFMAKNELTAQQAAFVDNYMVHYNAARAAKEANYKNCTRYGWQLLQLPHVIEEIENRAKAYSEARLGLKNRVVEELCSVAFTNLSDIGILTQNGLQIKDSDEIPESAMAALSEVSVTENEKSVNTKVRFHNKMQALDLIGKHLNMFKETGVQVNMTPYIIEKQDGSKVELGMRE